MTTPSTTTTLLTAEAFYDWTHRPENASKGFELVRGEVIEMPPPTKIHGAVAFNLGRLLGNYIFDHGRGYATSNDAGVVLERDPDTVRGPDLAYYEDAETFADLHPKYGEEPPRLAVEILSPGDRAARVMRKIADYLRTGVALVWVIDPESRTVGVHRPDKTPVILDANHELTGEDVLPDFRCRVADLFRLPGDKATT